MKDEQIERVIPIPQTPENRRTQCLGLCSTCFGDVSPTTPVKVSNTAPMFPGPRLTSAEAASGHRSPRHKQALIWAEPDGVGRSLDHKNRG